MFARKFILLLFSFNILLTTSIQDEELKTICSIWEEYKLLGPACLDPCTIEEIKCQLDLDTIVGLNLSKKTLNGTISTLFASLSNLTEIDLSFNELFGTIPTQFGLLSNLTSLKINFNNLNGPLPTQFGSLINLKELDIRMNELDGEIPIQIGLLVNLTYLNINNNYFFTTIPTQVGLLNKLQTLEIDNNDFFGTIPTQIENLNNLNKFVASLNRNLNVDNFFMFNMTKLEVLGLSFVNITDNLMSIGQFQSLSSLYLIGNFLKSFPNDLFQLTSLTYLDMSLNLLNGTIPSQIGQLQELQMLYLPFNNLRGTIPTQIGRMSNIVNMDLSTNSLTGNIPTQIGNFSMLRILNLDGNDGLSGELPMALANLTSLQEVNFSSTNLTCPQLTFEPTDYFLNICGNDISVQNETVLSGIVFYKNVLIESIGKFVGTNLNLETLNITINANSVIYMINSSIVVSGPMSISNVSLIISNSNLDAPAITTKGNLEIKPNSVLNLTIPNGLPNNQNFTIFSYTSKSGTFSKVITNGKECNGIYRVNELFITNQQCSSDLNHANQQVPIFSLIAICVLVIFIHM